MIEEIENSKDKTVKANDNEIKKEIDIILDYFIKLEDINTIEVENLIK